MVAITSLWATLRGRRVTLSAGGNNATSLYAGRNERPRFVYQDRQRDIVPGNSSSYAGSTIIAGGTLKLPAPAGHSGHNHLRVFGDAGNARGAVVFDLRIDSHGQYESHSSPKGATSVPPAQVSVLTDGINNTNHNAAARATWYSIGNNTSLTYTLPASTQGFNISNINLYCNWDDNGRSQISIANISYSTVGSPGVFTPFAGAGGSQQTSQPSLQQ